MNCQICGQAPAVRVLEGIQACNKKAHELNSKEKRMVKNALVGMRAQHRKINSETLPIPTFEMVATSFFKDKFPREEE